jgi:hypothetical protein
MLDVHEPEHPIHGVPDFLLHLCTIAVGLLIAFGLPVGAGTIGTYDAALKP